MEESRLFLLLLLFPFLLKIQTSQRGTSDWQPGGRKTRRGRRRGEKERRVGKGRREDEEKGGEGRRGEGKGSKRKGGDARGR